MKLTQNDIKYLVTETAKRVLKEYYGTFDDTTSAPWNQSYGGYGVLKVDQYDLCNEINDTVFNSMDEDTFNIEMDNFQGYYTIYIDGNGRITDDAGLKQDIEKVQNNELKQELYRIYDSLPEDPRVKWEDD